MIVLYFIGGIMMTAEKSVKRMRIRTLVHASSLVYIGLLSFLIFNQQRFIEGIIQKNFSITVNNVLLLFSAKDWQSVLADKIKLVINHLTILIVVQSVVILAGLVLIGYLLWQLKKKDRWRLSEKLVVFGYLFLVISLGIVLTKMMLEAYHTYVAIDQRINSLSTEELTILQEKLATIVLHSSFTLDQLIPSFLGVFEQVRTLIHTTRNIAGIPNLIQQSWEQLLFLKNWLIGLCLGGIAIVLIGHIVEGIRLFRHSQWVEKKLERRKNSRQIELNERLVDVIEQQQQLIKLLSEDKKNEEQR